MDSAFPSIQHLKILFKEYISDTNICFTDLLQHDNPSVILKQQMLMLLNLIITVTHDDNITNFHWYVK